MMAEPCPRRGPGPLLQALCRAVNPAVARFPWNWRLLRGPVRKFCASGAAGWYERVRSDSAEYLWCGTARPLGEALRQTRIPRHVQWCFDGVGVFAHRRRVRSP